MNNIQNEANIDGICAKNHKIDSESVMYILWNRLQKIIFDFLNRIENNRLSEICGCMPTSFQQLAQYEKID